jgi:hypothetical protein
MIEGDHIFQHDEQFDGMIGGHATVASGATVEISGMIRGNLTIEKGARVRLLGMVGGRIIGDGELY